MEALQTVMKITNKRVCIRQKALLHLYVDLKHFLGKTQYLPLKTCNNEKNKMVITNTITSYYDSM